MTWIVAVKSSLFGEEKREQKKKYKMRCRTDIFFIVILTSVAQLFDKRFDIWPPARHLLRIFEAEFLFFPIGIAALLLFLVRNNSLFYFVQFARGQAHNLLLGQKKGSNQ